MKNMSLSSFLQLTTFFYEFFREVIALRRQLINQYWEEDAEVAAAPLQMHDQRFFVPILSDKRSIDQKIRSLKERTANGQFKGILFGRKK
ncbi:hypothetical protein GCK72_016373 [Caenorhabditis remanei]|nr:hypothetical protein GCK72_016373 [Caenorhabditis remanei]KAF1749828.1 hypothetical protein GCK72_016373 [Caenorhabditis remanei]